MKRDIELVREILAALEELESFDEPVIPNIPDRSKHEVVYHIKLLSEAGLIEAQNWSTDGGPEWVATSLTSSGHDFLDAARSNTIWEKAKSIVVDQGSVLTIEALKVALSQVVRGAFRDLMHKADRGYAAG